MEIIRSFKIPDKKYKKPVLTIGKFDGVHLGHQKIIEKVLSEAKSIGGTSMALTFEPHPRKVLLTNEPFELLTLPNQKVELLERYGLNLLFIQKFTSKFSINGPEEFVREILVNKIGINTLVLGSDFSFGKDAAGDYELMKLLGKKYDFKVILVEPVIKNNEIVSSTIIRSLLKNGEMDSASDFLGRWYFIDGKVIRGEGRGREMNVPTANIVTKNELIPPQGVYLTRLDVVGSSFSSVTNIGVRPTFGGKYLSIESYLIDQNIDLYRKNLRLHFVKRIRDEKKFDSVEELLSQIKSDIQQARKIFSNL